MEHAIKELRNMDYKGIKINGKEIYMIRYADDIAIVAENANGLKHSLNVMDNLLNKYNMKINKKKQKLWCVTKQKLTRQLPLNQKK